MQKVVARQDSRGVHLNLNGAPVHFTSVKEAQTFLKKNVKGFLPIVGSSTNPWRNDKEGRHEAYYRVRATASAGRKTAKKKAKKSKTKSNPSQYTEQYLDATAKKPITVQTFLARVLKGKAKLYAGRYAQALIKDLKRIGAIPVTSVSGMGVSYLRPKYPKSDPWWNDKAEAHKAYFGTGKRKLKTKPTIKKTGASTKRYTKQTKMVRASGSYAKGNPRF